MQEAPRHANRSMCALCALRQRQLPAATAGKGTQRSPSARTHYRVKGAPPPQALLGTVRRINERIIIDWYRLALIARKNGKNEPGRAARGSGGRYGSAEFKWLARGKIMQGSRTSLRDDRRSSVGTTRTRGVLRQRLAGARASRAALCSRLEACVGDRKVERR